MQDILLRVIQENQPGDKGAKTKPSQYTKKFKQMYGEQDKEKKPQSDVMVDREKLKDLEVKKLQKRLQKTKKLLRRCKLQINKQRQKER